MNTGGVTYKTGVVVEAKPGFAKVQFADLDDLVTHWLPVIHAKTLDDKAIWTLDIGEHVACLMDSHMEDGCIVGAIYSEADAPPVTSPDKFRKQFKDGGSIEYDRATGAMVVVAMGAVTVTAQSVTLNTPQTTCTGKLTVQGLLTYQAGLVGSGGSGAAATISGNVQVDGSISDSGGNSNHHSHP